MFANIDQHAPPPMARPSNPRPKQEESTGRGPIMPVMQEFRPASGGGREFRPQVEGVISKFRPPVDAGRGQRPGRSARPSIGSEHSFDQSPLHPAKFNGRGGGGSPLWEARNNDGSNATPGRSRLSPVQLDVEKGAAVPRFGVWNESDPQSDQNFTHIFDKVREERNTAAPGNATPKQPSSTMPYRTNMNKPKAKKCLFGCW